MAVTEDQKPAADAGAAKPKDDKKKKKGEVDPDADLSEEDIKLRTDLELMVERVQDADPSLQRTAIASISEQIRSATTSMTSVPKPLKFLRAHYDTLKASALGNWDATAT